MLFDGPPEGEATPHELPFHFGHRPDVVDDGAVIGYYVHHHGHGHRHRALAVARASRRTVTGLSTSPPPPGWPGPWVRLRDDAVPTPTGRLDAFGPLHYAPDHHPGLRDRTAALSAWIGEARPRAMVVDVSVEVALLARLHGVPVVSMGMPGVRTDEPHRLGYTVSDAVLGPWPSAATDAGILTTADGVPARLSAVGAISRFDPDPSPADVSPQTVLVLNGSGGGGLSAAAVADVRTRTPGWDWTHLARGATWVADPWPLLRRSAVVVSHAGQNALAEIAAARRPAVLVPQDRPFDEQRTTGRVLAALGLPALVLEDWPDADEWPALLDKASALDGADWVRWNDGAGPQRAAALIEQTAGGGDG